MEDFPGAELIGRRKGWGFEMGRRQQNMVATEDVGKPSELFVVCGVPTSPWVSRRDHVDSSPKRTDGVLQADIDRALKTYPRESAQDAVRRRRSLTSLDCRVTPVGSSLS